MPSLSTLARDRPKACDSQGFGHGGLKHGFVDDDVEPRRVVAERGAERHRRPRVAVERPYRRTPARRVAQVEVSARRGRCALNRYVVQLRNRGKVPRLRPELACEVASRSRKQKEVLDKKINSPYCFSSMTAAPAGMKIRFATAAPWTRTTTPASEKSLPG